MMELTSLKNRAKRSIVTSEIPIRPREMELALDFNELKMILGEHHYLQKHESFF